jgi:hypothetical protein
MSTKKYFFLFLLSAVSLTNWHCSKKIEGFDMVYRSKFPRDIPASVSTLLSHNFIIENISSNATDFYASHSATDADVLKIIPKTARISAVFNDADFVFVNRVYVYVYPVGEPSKKTEVFYREDIPVNTGAAINLTGGVADVKKIVGASDFTMEVRLDVRGQPSRNIETAIDFSFYAVTKE